MLGAHAPNLFPNFFMSHHMKHKHCKALYGTQAKTHNMNMERDRIAMPHPHAWWTVYLKAKLVPACTYVVHAIPQRKVVVDA